MENQIYLSVVIPAYNEENRLPKTLEEIDKYLRKQSYTYEIIVISDGSKDRTADVVRGLMPKIQNLKLINNKDNHGKGYVVRQGLLEAKGKYRLFTDADNSTSVDQVEKMWPWLEKEFDIVIGSRDLPESVLAVSQPWLRKIILGGGFKLFRKFIIGLWEISDTQCGFKCFTNKSAEYILPKCKIDRFAFDPEILVVGKLSGYKIKEIPVTWINDLESKVKFKSIIKMAFDLIKIRLNLIKGIYGKKE
ncbi:MAG TPA: dolichyl-phosphate beta-glucosyltransferase [Candidatus Parcubacteria bacterium]|jgi:dolichyl-phosphate beta-glucosyltransferase|nr:dolichyl-phosphate beta-glucosyltransferase [Candidatus Parcubacteria bacterium]|tara:strand:+ start:15004 stop:15747 length:744 start_codon:yes stop_codon:yes gene_type:complete